MAEWSKALDLRSIGHYCPRGFKSRRMQFFGTVSKNVFWYSIQKCIFRNPDSNIGCLCRLDLPPNHRTKCEWPTNRKKNEKMISFYQTSYCTNCDCPAPKTVHLKPNNRSSTTARIFTQSRATSIFLLFDTELSDRTSTRRIFQRCDCDYPPRLPTT